MELDSCLTPFSKATQKAMKLPMSELKLSTVFKWKSVWSWIDTFLTVELKIQVTTVSDQIGFVMNTNFSASKDRETEDMGQNGRNYL